MRKVLRKLPSEPPKLSWSRQIAAKISLPLEHIGDIFKNKTEDEEDSNANKLHSETKETIVEILNIIAEKDIEMLNFNLEQLLRSNFTNRDLTLAITRVMQNMIILEEYGKVPSEKPFQAIMEDILLEAQKKKKIRRKVVRNIYASKKVYFTIYLILDTQTIKREEVLLKKTKG